MYVCVYIYIMKSKIKNNLLYCWYISEKSKEKNTWYLDIEINNHM